jgi:hypothetical protein
MNLVGKFREALIFDKSQDILSGETSGVAENSLTNHFTYSSTFPGSLAAHLNHVVHF